MSRSQCESILGILLIGGKITPLQALEWFGCFRLGARIHDLRTGKYDGQCYTIVTNNITKNGKTYAQYYMEESNAKAKISNQQSNAK